MLADELTWDSFPPVVASAALDRSPVVRVPISSLARSDSPRINGEDAEYVRLLSDVVEEIPPIVVHRGTMRIVDGMHRFRAAALRGDDTIEVRFYDGDECDVFALAVELNSRNSLPLSHNDRVSATGRILTSHPHWSDRVVAPLVGLSPKTVAAIRRHSADDALVSPGRVGRDGKIRPLSTVRGRELASRLITERPTASVREIAREAGVSIGTVQDVRQRLRLGEDPVPPRQRRMQHTTKNVPTGATKDVPEPTVQYNDPEITAQLLARLQNDPSLRFTGVGRAVLRLLNAHSIPGATWLELADAVPDHCVDAVAGVARGCANYWLQFADEVTKRSVRQH